MSKALDLRKHDPAELAEWLNDDPKQIKALVDSYFAANASVDDLRACLQEYPQKSLAGESVQMVTAVAPSPAINQSALTMGMNIVNQAEFNVKQLGQSSVIKQGTVVNIHLPWASGWNANYAEVQKGSQIPLPGYGGSQPPVIPQEIPLGSESQPNFLNSWSDGSQMMGGPYGFPSMKVPPNVAALPDWSDASWAASKYLFVPGTLTPYIPPNDTSNLAGVLLRLGTAWQTAESVTLWKSFYAGRMVTMLTEMYSTGNLTGTSFTGSCASGLVPDVRQNSWTQTSIMSQSNKSQVMVRSLLRDSPSSEGGIRQILGPEVLEELKPLNFEFIGGDSPAGQTEVSIWDTIIKATGISGNPPGSEVWQAPNSSKYIAGTSKYLANGVTDRPGSAFASVIWVSSKWQTSGSNFAQVQQLDATQCQLGDNVCNTYPQTVFSQANCATYTPVTNVIIPPYGDLCLPKYQLRWEIGMGAANSMSFGHIVDVYGSIDPETGEVDFAERSSGLGVWGLTGADSGHPYWGISGVIPGGMFQTHKWDHSVQHAPGDTFMKRGKDYMGSFIFFQGMPNAQMKVSLFVNIPRLYATGVIGPAFVTRMDGLGVGQQITIKSNQTWEVVCTQQTMATANRDPVQRALVNPSFPDLMRDIFQNKNCRLFTNVMSGETWKSTTARVLGSDMAGLMRLFADNKVLEMDGMLLKLKNVMTKPSLSMIEGAPGARSLESAEEGREIPPSFQGAGDYGAGLFGTVGDMVDHFVDGDYGAGLFGTIGNAVDHFVDGDYGAEGDNGMYGAEGLNSTGELTSGSFNRMDGLGIPGNPFVDKVKLVVRFRDKYKQIVRISLKELLGSNFSIGARVNTLLCAIPAVDLGQYMYGDVQKKYSELMRYAAQYHGSYDVTKEVRVLTPGGIAKYVKPQLISDPVGYFIIVGYSSYFQRLVLLTGGEWNSILREISRELESSGTKSVSNDTINKIVGIIEDGVNEAAKIRAKKNITFEQNIQMLGQYFCQLVAQNAKPKIDYTPMSPEEFDQKYHDDEGKLKDGFRYPKRYSFTTGNPESRSIKKRVSISNTGDVVETSRGFGPQMNNAIPSGDDENSDGYVTEPTRYRLDVRNLHRSNPLMKNFKAMRKNVSAADGIKKRSRESSHTPRRVLVRPA